MSEKSEKTRSRSALGVGLSTVMTVMVVVLLTTFSVLALVSARAELRLANRAIESTANYYTADGEAERWLADLDAFISEERGDREGDLASAGYQVSATDEGQTKLTESFAIDERRDLIVEIALDSAGEMDILRWQTMPKRVAE
ncbi:MAG: hypothetical protein LBK67_07740 [Coriobacteriales bacterium]|jgi:hypothetical protein|nr:hypothetical protein [Coriobacteriales bacterium]